MIQYDMTLGHDTIPQQAEISPQLYLFEIATPRNRYSYSERSHPEGAENVNLRN